ncbi:MAG: thiamine pyrophosphate-binding protein [Candidatus Wallbacteria bacterium]|nr:thiamine pyrophosphate-binding protein [Candidatus Wallbacteria bacterium]
MDVNEAIVKTLENIGVDHVFGGSGQVNASMLLALEASKQIKTVIVRNEQAASFMACGYSMFSSDRLGVCFATGGPGAFNLFSGMAVALSDSLPILGITGYTSAPDRGKGALNESTGKKRTADSHAMFQATTKKSYIIEDASQTCDILEDAINTAFEGRPGPVHIHVPKNVTTAEVKNFREIKLNIKPVLPKPKDIRLVTDALAKALDAKIQMMVLVGYGTIRSHAEQDVLAFVERFQIPFASTMDAKGALPENHPLSLGVYGTSGDPGANRYFDGCKAVIALGNSFAQNATFGFKPDLYDSKVLFHVNIDREEINKVYKADYSIISDIKSAVTQIITELSGKVGEFPKKTVEKDKWYHHKHDYKGTRIFPGDLVEELSRLLPEKAFIIGDAGAHMLWLNCHLSLDKGQVYQNPGSFGPMASNVNSSMGIKCAHPDRVVVCGCGDGAYQMAGFDLMTAVQYDIPVIWVIFNNGEFNVIKKFLINMYNRHAFMTFDNPDFKAYAEACGALGFRVEKLADFEGAFKKALESNKPALIDVVVESEVYPPFNLGKV